jgi:putative tricarboxylic transport membrane protein
VLGDLLDLNLRRGLLLTNGDPTPFFTRPISAVICLIIVFTILMSIPAVSKRVRAIFSRSSAESPAKG